MPPMRTQPKRSVGVPSRGLPTTYATPPTSTTNTKSSRPASTRILNPARVLTSTSPLTSSTYNISSFLAQIPTLWPSYTPKEQHDILSTLPPAYRNPIYNPDGTLQCPLTKDFFENDEFLRNAVAKFKREVKDGYYEKTWQDNARRAMRERAEGKFDNFLKNQVEEQFGEEEDNEGEDDSDVGMATAVESRVVNGGEEAKKAKGRPRKVRKVILDGDESMDELAA